MMLAFFSAAGALNSRIPQRPNMQGSKIPQAGIIQFDATFPSNYNKGVSASSINWQVQTCIVVNNVESCDALSTPAQTLTSGSAQQSWYVSGNVSATWTGKVRVVNNTGYEAYYTLTI